MASWKEVAHGLEEVVQILPSPADTAVKLMVKLASFTYSVLGDKGVIRQNQQLVEQLAQRALIVSRTIELYVAQCRAQDEAFTTFVSGFHRTMEEVMGFVETFRQKRWLGRILTGDEVAAQSDVLLRRLEALAADYRDYLLKNMVFRGPAERIDHPLVREFWRFSMKNDFEAKWVHFWDQLQHDVPATAQFLSGPLASRNMVILQAKAKGPDPHPSRDIEKAGPWEMNNLFQPPNAPVENIIATVLADANRALPFNFLALPSVIVAKTSRSRNKRIRSELGSEACPAEAMEVQLWSGYWTRGCHTGVMTVELLVAANHTILGGGSDEIGEFTCTGKIKNFQSVSEKGKGNEAILESYTRAYKSIIKGECRGAQVRFVKQYIGQHHVEYDGAIKNAIINGTWTKDIGPSRRGAFRLEQKVSWIRAVPNARESGIVQIGVQIGRMQRWAGHCVKGGRKLNMNVDVIFTETNKIFGSGEDDVGRFTWLGRYHPMSHSTLVNINKQYEGKYVVYYMGEVERRLTVPGREDLSVFMKGSWVSSNKLENGPEKGTFCFQPEVHSSA